MRIVIGPNSNKIALEQKSGLLNAVKTGNIEDLVKHYGELEYSKLEEDRQHGYNRRRLRLLKKLEGIITKEFDSPPSIYSSHENYKKEQWRLVHRRVFKKYGYTGEQFRMQSNRFWVSNYGRLIYFNNLDTESPTPVLCTERPNIDTNYVKSGFPNSKINVTDDPDDNNNDNADPDYIKLLKVPRSYVVFFTFYKWDDEKLGEFNKDTMVIDHINGDKSDNHFINLYPLPKESNVKVRDKLNRNNVYGTNAVCKGGEEDDDNGIPRDILWIGKPTNAGSATPAKGYIVYKNGKVGAIRKRARMEVEAGHFNKLCCNHILYIFFKRRDLYVLKEKFFDKAYLIDSEAASNNNETGSDDNEEEEDAQQQPERRRGGGAASLLREDTTAQNLQNHTPNDRAVTPGSATVQQQRRGRNGGGGTVTRITVDGSAYNPGNVPTPQALQFSRNNNDNLADDDDGEGEPPGNEDEEENGATIGDLLILSKHQFSIIRGDNNSEWRGSNSIFHVLFYQLKKIGKLDYSFNGIILKKIIANFVRDHANQPLTYEKNTVQEYVEKQKDSSDAKYCSVDRYVSDLLQGRDGGNGGNDSGSCGGVVEGFITSVLYNVTVVYWYHDAGSGEITQCQKWDAANGGSKILHVFCEGINIGNSSYCPMDVDNDTDIFLDYIINNNELDEESYSQALHVNVRRNKNLYATLKRGDIITLQDDDDDDDATLYKIEHIEDNGTIDDAKYTLSTVNDTDEDDIIRKLCHISGPAQCHACTRVDMGPLQRCLTCPTPFCNECFSNEDHRLLYVKCTYENWRHQCRTCQGNSLISLPDSLRRKFPQTNRVKFRVFSGENYFTSNAVDMDAKFAESSIFLRVANSLMKHPRSLVFEHTSSERKIHLRLDTPHTFLMTEGTVEDIHVREEERDRSNDWKPGTCRNCLSPGSEDDPIHTCGSCNGGHCTECLGGMLEGECPSCDLFSRIIPGTTRVRAQPLGSSRADKCNVLSKVFNRDGNFSELKIERISTQAYTHVACDPRCITILGRLDDSDDDDDDPPPNDDDDNNNGGGGGGGGESNYNGQSGEEAEEDDNVDEGGNGSDNEGGNGSENEDGSIGGASEGGEDANTGTENLSEYELARLKRIARNKARLRALGLLKEQITPPKKTRCKRKSTEPTTPSRASKRLKGLEPDGKTIISKDTSEDTSSRPPVQEQQSLPPISDNEDDDDWYTPDDSGLSCCSSEEEEETYERPRKRSCWEMPFSQLQDIEGDDGTELNAWKDMFKQLVKYKSDHGHASPRLNDSENKELALWAYEQRIISNEGMLDKTRRECLLLIGFILKSTANGTPFTLCQIWNERYDDLLDHDVWMKRYNELVRYNEVNGTTNVSTIQPKIPTIGWSKELGGWVAKQRAHHKKKAKYMTEDRIQMLNSIGFEWEVRVGWDERLEELKQFKKKNGHCNVPSNYKANPHLGQWVHNQRKAYKKKGCRTEITEDQIELLNGIGFSWNRYEEKWNIVFEELKHFRKEYGHCRVNRKSNPQLGHWVSNQRRARKTLSSGQIRRLERLGFEWVLGQGKMRRQQKVPHNKIWDERFKELQEYKQVNGNCNVSAYDEDNSKLGKWVNRQRTAYKKNKLSKKRTDLLDEIGFEWQLSRPSVEVWDERLEELIQFNEEHGHSNVPRSYKANPKLAVWVNTQRTSYKRGKLSSDQIKQLNGIGFIWNRNEEEWKKMFEELKQYKVQTGHCRVPGKYKANPQLGAWVNNQRQLYKKGKLSPEQIKCMNSIGFEWEVRVSWDERCEELKQYKVQTGNCNVPDKYPANPQLGKWVMHQRTAYKKGKLSSEQTESMNEIGFEWVRKNRKK